MTGSIMRLKRGSEKAPWEGRGGGGSTGLQSRTEGKKRYQVIVLIRKRIKHWTPRNQRSSSLRGFKIRGPYLDQQKRKEVMLRDGE